MENPVMGITPYLTVSDAKAAIDFYVNALDGKEVARHYAPESERVMHARVDIHGSTIMLSDDFPEYHGGKGNSPEAFGGSPVGLHLQVDDAQAVWDKAVAAGATVKMPLKEQFWGDIYGQFTDPSGHNWSIGQSVKNPSAEELKEGAKEAFDNAKAKV